MEAFILNSGLNLHHNALYNLIILDATRQEVDDLSQFIFEHVGEKYNFFSQPDKFANYEEYFFYHIGIFTLITLMFIILMIYHLHLEHGTEYSPND